MNEGWHTMWEGAGVGEECWNPREAFHGLAFSDMETTPWGGNSEVDPYRCPATASSSFPEKGLEVAREHQLQ